MDTHLTDDDEQRRLHPLNWIGWILAALFVATAAGLAHHAARLQRQLNTSEGNASQLQAQLNHASQIVAVLTSPEATHILLTENRQPPHPVGQVSWLADKGALAFVAGGLRPISADRTYELWLVPEREKAPIPAGLFRPNAEGGATVVLPPVPANTQAKSFMVTVEPAQGSETPSLPIVMQGQAP